MSNTPDRSSDLSQIFDEFLARRQRGESPVLDEYCQRFPDLAEQLRLHVRLYDALETVRPEGDTTLRDPGVLPRIPATRWKPFLVRVEPASSLRRDLRLGRPVAIKMLLSGAYAGPTELMRFQFEAEAVAGLCHANVVQLYEVGEHEGRPYFSMELVEGGSLAQKLAARPTGNVGDSQQVRWAAELVATLAEAVSVAHRAGIIHRDLKPGNILLTADGTPKVSDFGLARRLKGEGGLTWTGTAVGTPSYMAPEQASDTAGPIGPASDVYGLGAVLYELLTGRPPFRAGSALETFRQILSKEPTPPSRLNPKVPRDLETVCLKCLHKAPQRRYTSAAASGRGPSALFAGSGCHRTARRSIRAGRQVGSAQQGSRGPLGRHGVCPVGRVGDWPGHSQPRSGAEPGEPRCRPGKAVAGRQDRQGAADHQRNRGLPTVGGPFVEHGK